MRIGERLMEAGLITEDVLDAGLRTQAQYGGRLVSILVELRALDGDAATRVLSTHRRAPSVLKKHFDAFDRHALARVPAKVAEKYGAIALGFSGQSSSALIVAMIDPTDFRAVEELQFLTGMKIMPGVALQMRIQEALRRHYKIAGDQRFQSVAEGGLDIADFAESTSFGVKSVQTATSQAPSAAMRSARPLQPDLTLDAPSSGRSVAAAPISSPPQFASATPSHLTAPPPPAPVRHLTAPPPPAPPHLSAPHLTANTVPPTRSLPPPSAPPRSSPPLDAPPLPPPALPPRAAAAHVPFALHGERPPPSTRDVETLPAMPQVHEAGSLPPFVPKSAPPTVSWSVPPSGRPPARAFVAPIPRGDPEEARGAAEVGSTPEVLLAGEAIRRIEQSASLEHKVDLLIVYLKGVFEASVVFAVRNDIAFIWKAFGPGIRGAVPPKIAIPLTQPSLLQTPYEARTVFCGAPTIEGANLHARLWETLRTKPPREAIAIPIVLEDRVAAIVYAHPRGDQRVASTVLVEVTSVCAAIPRHRA